MYKCRNKHLVISRMELVRIFMSSREKLQINLIINLWQKYLVLILAQLIQLWP